MVVIEIMMMVMIFVIEDELMIFIMEMFISTEVLIIMFVDNHNMFIIKFIEIKCNFVSYTVTYQLSKR